MNVSFSREDANRSFSIRRRSTNLFINNEDEGYHVSDSRGVKTSKNPQISPSSNLLNMRTPLAPKSTRAESLEHRKRKLTPLQRGIQNKSVLDKENSFLNDSFSIKVSYMSNNSYGIENIASRP